MSADTVCSAGVDEFGDDVLKYADRTVNDIVDTIHSVRAGFINK